MELRTSGRNRPSGKRVWGWRLGQRETQKEGERKRERETGRETEIARKRRGAGKTD